MGAQEDGMSAVGARDGVGDVCSVGAQEEGGGGGRRGHRPSRYAYIC